MPSDIADVVRNSLLYWVASKLLVWTKHSTIARLLGDERVLAAIITIGLLGSLFRVLSSSMQAPVKFLSFALLFVTLTALTWNYTEPLTNM